MVVIGIITLLVAMLMPALARVREQANRVKCAANLRTIGQGLTMYSQQYGAYPACYIQLGLNSHCGLWPVRLRPFFGGDQGVFYCPSQDERCEWKKGRIPVAVPGGLPVQFATDLHARFGYEVGEPLLPHFSGYFSYGYNLFGTDAGGPIASQKGLGAAIALSSTPPPLVAVPEMRANRVKKPAEMIAVADSTADGFWDLAVMPAHGPGTALPGRVHAGGPNVLFCDGHVQWYPQKDLLVTQTFIPSEAPIRRMWNNDHEPNW